METPPLMILRRVFSKGPTTIMKYGTRHTVTLFLQKKIFKKLDVLILNVW